MQKKTPSVLGLLCITSAFVSAAVYSLRFTMLSKGAQLFETSATRLNRHARARNAEFGKAHVYETNLPDARHVRIEQWNALGPNWEFRASITDQASDTRSLNHLRKNKIIQSRPRAQKILSQMGFYRLHSWWVGAIRRGHCGPPMTISQTHLRSSRVATGPFI